MFQGLHRRVTSLGLWGSVCFFFSLFIASGSLVLGAFILAGILLLVAILMGPQFIAAFWLLGSPTIFGFPNEILRLLPFVTMERILLALLAGMVFLKMAFVKTHQPRLIFLEALILIFLSYALVSLALHTTPERLSHDGWFLLQYALPMTAFIVSRRIQWSENGLRLLLAGITAVGVFLAIVGVLQLLFGVTIFTTDYQTITLGHKERAYGTFSNAHTYVATLFIFLILTLIQVNIYRDYLIRFVLLSAMLMIVIGIILGQSRAPWGGGVIALFIIYLRDREVRSLLVAGGIVALLGGIVVLLIKIDDLGSFINRVSDLGTMAGRLATWSTALNMIAHNPVFGVGFGADSFLLHKAEYITSIGSLPAEYALHLSVPHNEYLHIAVQLGLLGLAIFLAIMYNLVKLLITTYRDEEYPQLYRKLSLYIGAIVIGLLFNSLFSDTYLQDYFWTVTYFLAGLVTGAHGHREYDVLSSQVGQKP